MKKILLCSVAAFGLLSTPAQADDLKFYTFDFKPFAGAEAAGPFKDIISEVCTRLSHTCSFEVMPWARAQAVAKDEGGIAGLFPMGKNAAREEWLNFSVPLIQTEYGFYVPESDNTTYADVSSVSGYTVSTFGPSNTATKLEKLAGENGFTAAIEKSMDISMKKVAGGRYEGKNAAFGNVDVMKDLIKSEGISGLKYLGQQKPVTYYIGMPKNSMDDKAEAFNTTLKAMQSDGTMKTILDKYNMNMAQ